jgi:hypothetical protein
MKKMTVMMLIASLFLSTLSAHTLQPCEVKLQTNEHVCCMHSASEVKVSHDENCYCDMVLSISIPEPAVALQPVNIIPTSFHFHSKLHTIARTSPPFEPPRKFA